MIKLQNDTVPTPLHAVEIDAAILDIQTRLNASLAWLTHGYGKTYRNVDTSRGVTVYFPEVYLGDNKYMRITPDNDKTGQCFFLVGNEEINDYQQFQKSFLSYDLAIVFCANLETINATRHATELSEQNLIQEVRRVLNTQLTGGGYVLELLEVVREFGDVYTEFSIEEKRGISHAPLTHFRFNCTITIREYCDDTPFDRCATILSMINATERDCLGNAIGGGACDWNDCSALLAGMSTTTKNTCVLPTYNFADTDVQNNVTQQQQDDLIDWLCVPGCIADFTAGSLTAAAQIQFNVGQSVCVNDVKYCAIEGINNLGADMSTHALTNGKYWGYFKDGGANNVGYLYSINTDGTGFAYKYSFSTATGATPVGKLAPNGVTFYGTTSAGGANGFGTVFGYNTDTETYTVLTDLSNTTGYLNTSNVGDNDPILHGGFVYELFGAGGANGLGTITKFNTTTGVATVIYDITAADLISQTGVSPVQLSLASPIIADTVNNNIVAAYHNQIYVIDAADNVTKYTLEPAATSQFSAVSMQIDGTTLNVFCSGAATTRNRLVQFDLSNSYARTIIALGIDRYLAFGYVANGAIYGAINNPSISFTVLKKYTLAGAFTADLHSFAGFIKSELAIDGTALYVRETGLISKIDLTTELVADFFDTNDQVITTPDGTNIIDINQAPIYLQLC